MIKKLILSLGLFATLSFGATMEESSKMALDILEKLANNGNVEVQNKLGLMYTNGEGVRQDKKIAKEWFLRACDGGLQNACDNYKKLNEQGIDYILLLPIVVVIIILIFFCYKYFSKSSIKEDYFSEKAYIESSISILISVFVTYSIYLISIKGLNLENISQRNIFAELIISSIFMILSALMIIYLTTRKAKIEREYTNNSIKTTEKVDEKGEK
ncbi:Sel1 domain-containing protein [Aliarcobacter faecis]|uniref:tetratricopeptide repeat protein n=1 Tax=Aliarcobacter faecis TaxID=1564138 RepID=UPI0004B027B4|nr:tetratricopeptide repeat protein [Aliarcobacter faecis]QKF73880.1 Sel1 domain-containing protein [Aliarcobacter faecis]